MRRWILPALMITLLLNGCGNAAAGRKLDDMQKTLAAAREISMTADVTANLGEERFSCTLRCASSPEGFTVEVLAPETVAGVCARISRDGAAIEYDGLSLGVGGLGPDASPVPALPLLTQALCGGSTMRDWSEREGEQTLYVRESYGTEDTSVSVWYDAQTLTPVHAEFQREGITVIRCEIREFHYE